MSGDEGLRVLWFSQTPSSGGSRLGLTTVAGGWIESLERQLRERIDLSVAFYHTEAARPYEHDGTTFYPLVRSTETTWGKTRSRLTDRLESERDVSSLMELVDKVRPDLVHVHGTEGPFGLIQRHTEIPVLISLQSVLSAYELKFFTGLDRATVQRLAGIRDTVTRNTYADRYRRFTRQAEREREILALTRHLTGRTEWDRRVSSLLATNATYHHLDEILREPFYEHSWLPPANGRLELFTTTGPNLYKGFETLLRCGRLLESAGIEYRWRVAGLAASDPFVALFLRALHMELPSRVQLLGTLDERDIIDAMLGSDLYVGVSHIENSPNSLCEAQLLGLPCLATYAGGTASLVTDDRDGVLVQDGDPYAMAGAILELTRDPDRAARLGSSGRARALLRHDRDTVVERVLDIYRGLVNVG